MPDFLTTPVPHSEGAAFIRSKPVVTRAIFDALAPELQARAFLITGVESLDVVARVRDLTARLPEGGDYEDLKGQILDELSPWLVTSTDPEERAKQVSAARRRAELLLRMHGWQAYARTNHAMIMASKDIFTYCEYLSREDKKVRPTHAALHGKIIPSDHPFWINHTPPWEYGCRCDKAGMMDEEVAEIRENEKDLPMEERRVLNNYQLQQLAKGLLFARGKNGSLGWIDVRTPYERTGTGYEWRPDDEPSSVDLILSRFTPAERVGFEGFAENQSLEDGQTFLNWWKIKPSATPPIPGQAETTAPPKPPAAAMLPGFTTTPEVSPVFDPPAVAPAVLAGVAEELVHTGVAVTAARSLPTLEARVAALAKANAVDAATAAGWLQLIGDKPEFVPDGRVMVPGKGGKPSGRMVIWPTELNPKRES